MLYLLINVLSVVFIEIVVITIPMWIYYHFEDRRKERRVQEARAEFFRNNI